MGGWHEFAQEFAEIFVRDGLGGELLEQADLHAMEGVVAEAATEHVQDPGAFFVEHDVPGENAAVIEQALAEVDGAGGFDGLAGFLAQKVFAVLLEQSVEGGGSFGALDELEGGVIGHGFHEPVGAVIGGRNQVAPPLVGDFVGQEHFGKEGIEARIAKLGGALFGAQIGDGGEIDQAGEALPEVAGDGRDGDAVDRQEGPAAGVIVQNIFGLGEDFVGIFAGCGGIGKGFDVVAALLAGGEFVFAEIEAGKVFRDQSLAMDDAEAGGDVFADGLAG